MDERAALAGDGVFNRGMRVPERIDTDAAEQIEISVALLIDEMNAFAAHKENRIALIGGEQQPFFRGANLIELRHFFSS